MILNFPQKRVSWKTWERFVVPVLQDRRRETVIFYKMEKSTIQFSTVLGGYNVFSEISIHELLKLYEDRQIQVDLEAPPETSNSALINKFNQDFLDSRGVPEE